ncbi:MAG TPA: tRNA (adenosine(37)-N6)-dimethylallyltransferase MiaA [Clostridia bacterium]|nr:tRNA (adenosine(37)-N6)-dimethylallyltransferase MiaA [Clostridia bacterium]
MKDLLVITGPTATGKTELAINIARKINGEIISADSMLVYKGMDIGTAKPSAEDLEKAKHYMIDIVNPDEEFNVAIYKEMVEELIEDITDRGKLPIMAGGTGLYIKAVIDDYTFKDTETDPNFRSSLLEMARLKGTEHLHKELSLVDSATANKLHPNDTRRIIRALEIYNEKGKPLSSISPRDARGRKYKVKMFGLRMRRENLYNRINNRVDEMLSMGLIEEVRGLLLKGYDTGLVSMKGLGYKEMASFIKGETTLEEATYLLKRNTRRFAKRQLTWFRKETRINWIDVEKHSDPLSIVGEIISKLEGLPQDT